MGRAVFLLAFLLGARALVAADTLPPLADGKPPQTFDELWSGYDPTVEPLDVQVVHEWKTNIEGRDITSQLLTYAIGTFKGKPSRIAAYYGFPTDATGKIPGVLEIHGGGQRALRPVVEAMAANGYACLAINWGAKTLDDQKPGDPGTDWGAVDATQTTHVTHYQSLVPDDKTIDSMLSPRNSNWYLITIAGRRGLTFLGQQPMVDAARLGVFGHSMGGILTVMVAGSDPRVKAAAPSCGGAGELVPESIAKRPGAGYRNRITPENAIYFDTIDEVNALRRIKVPMLYQGPHNDFNANYDIVDANWREIPGASVHFSVSPHLDHRHLPESDFAVLRFFNVHLLGEGTFPRTPQLAVDLKTGDGVPLATVTPDTPADVVKVQVYYSVNPHALTRFWRRAETVREGDTWKARLPVTSFSMPLFVMANVQYPQPRPLIGPPWQRQSPPNFIVSSHQVSFAPSDLQSAGIKESPGFERVIQDSFDDWGDWYELQRANPGARVAATRKLTDPKWRAPDGADLAIDVLEPSGGELLFTFEVNRWNAYDKVPLGRFYAVAPLVGSPDWQTVTFRLDDLKPVDEKSPPQLADWQGITELGIVAEVRGVKDGKDAVLAAARWSDARKFRRLRWVGGTYTKPALLPGGALSEADYKRIFQQSIDQSVQQEKQDADGAR